MYVCLYEHARAFFFLGFSLEVEKLKSELKLRLQLRFCVLKFFASISQEPNGS